MDKEWTTEDLKRIAKACGIQIVRESGDELFVDEIWPDTGETVHAVFCPHLDANQAIKCLDRISGKQWCQERRPEGFWVLFQRGDSIGQCFPAAAMAAIMARLEGDDD